MKCTKCGRDARLMAQTGIRHDDEPGLADVVLAELWECSDCGHSEWIDMRQPA